MDLFQLTTATDAAEHTAAAKGSDEADVAALREENRRLRKVCQALMERVETGGGADPAPYAAFERSVLLAEQVRERTDALHRTLDELSQVNTRLLAAKAEAEAANLSKTKFLAAVSHDLLQPLNAARLFASALETHSLPETSQMLVSHIGRSLKDVEGLIGTLVDISRLDAGVLHADKAPFAVSTLLDALAEEYRQVAGVRGLALHYVPSSAVVESDLALLARVVRNFLSNAVRYTDQGRVLLGCRRRRDGLEIMVGDTGPGIPEQQREAIFLEFRRANQPNSAHSRGLGLGLAIVDRISIMLEQPISLASRPGVGALFSITVPYATATVPAVSNTRSAILPEADEEALSGCVIWVIDDDLAIIEGMQALLGSWGCRVRAAATVSALEAASDGERPAVLLVDYHLGEHRETGIELAARLQRRYPGLAAVVITANHEAEIKRATREAGMHCLLKPLKPLRLRMLLGTLLNKA
ncbi:MULTISPECIES: hybrid sensor histidine kinase/response regulator [Halomonadaceae]|uniref:histidine kinase n=1 Tax=Vreelandella titanicae TaxID=664683 RepID=A0A558J8W1_9GAMM|nr:MULTISPECIES: hybrid sensor histidine kinase/response regulator [Halomonas]MBR9902700.1 hybrid sensor histidine kinase/response regulator [Gammaproteobacteria bacterium]TVU90061.1 hybrid sensor histidine kinase/response regulator [Halomonas titanicae]